MGIYQQIWWSVYVISSYYRTQELRKILAVIMICIQTLGNISSYDDLTIREIWEVVVVCTHSQGYISSYDDLYSQSEKYLQCTHNQGYISSYDGSVYTHIELSAQQLQWMQSRCLFAGPRWRRLRSQQFPLHCSSLLWGSQALFDSLAGQTICPRLPGHVAPVWQLALVGSNADHSLFIWFSYPHCFLVRIWFSSKKLRYFVWGITSAMKSVLQWVFQYCNTTFCVDLPYWFLGS